mmetsp:Transcript_17595/g.38101  ORF Transcript_17595/g.38101 Transcript_17595/m.38101 type:complete len:203 (-) Transcript_17595:201-809(-)
MQFCQSWRPNDSQILLLGGSVLKTRVVGSVIQTIITITTWYCIPESIRVASYRFSVDKTRWHARPASGHGHSGSELLPFPPQVFELYHLQNTVAVSKIVFVLQQLLRQQAPRAIHEREYRDRCTIQHIQQASVSPLFVVPLPRGLDYLLDLPIPQKPLLRFHHRGDHPPERTGSERHLILVGSASQGRGLHHVTRLVGGHVF